MKNSSGTIGNRTRDLPGCSAVPQPTAPPGTPTTYCHQQYSFDSYETARLHTVHTNDTPVSYRKDECRYAPLSASKAILSGIGCSAVFLSA
jgi:hypothetical protein